MLKEAGDLAEAPNGNGGLYISLHKLGLLEMLTAQGVESIFQFGVDNVLCHAVDPIFVGFCDASDAECGVKASFARPISPPPIAPPMCPTLLFFHAPLSHSLSPPPCITAILLPPDDPQDGAA